MALQPLARYTRGIGPAGPTPIQDMGRMVPAIGLLNSKAEMWGGIARFAELATNDVYERLKLQRQAEAQRDAGGHRFERDAAGFPIMPTIDSETTVYGSVYTDMIRQRYLDETRATAAGKLNEYRNANPMDPQAYAKASSSFLETTLANVDPAVRGLVETQLRSTNLEFLSSIENSVAKRDWSAGAKAWEDELSRLGSEVAGYMAGNDPRALEGQAALDLQLQSGLSLGYISPNDLPHYQRAQSVQNAYATLQNEFEGGDPGRGMALAQSLRAGPGAPGYREEWAVFTPEDREWLAGRLDSLATNQAQLDNYYRAKGAQARSDEVDQLLWEMDEKAFTRNERFTNEEILVASQRALHKWGPEAARAVLSRGTQHLSAQRERMWAAFDLMTSEETALGSLFKGAGKALDDLFGDIGREPTEAEISLSQIVENGGGVWNRDIGQLLDAQMGGNAWAVASDQAYMAGISRVAQYGMLPATVADQMRAVVSNDQLPAGPEVTRALQTYRALTVSRAGQGNVETMLGSSATFWQTLDEQTSGDTPTAGEWQRARDLVAAPRRTTEQAALAFGYETTSDLRDFVMEETRERLTGALPLMDTMSKQAAAAAILSGNMPTPALHLYAADDIANRVMNRLQRVPTTTEEGIAIATQIEVNEYMRTQAVSWTSIPGDASQGTAPADGPTMMSRKLAFETVAAIPGDDEGKWHRGFVANAVVGAVATKLIPYRTDAMDADLKSGDPEAILRHARVAHAGELDAKGVPVFQIYVNTGGAWIPTGVRVDWHDAWAKEAKAAGKRMETVRATRFEQLREQQLEGMNPWLGGLHDRWMEATP